MQQFAVSSWVQVRLGSESALYSLAVYCNALLITIKPHPDLAGGRATHYRKRLDVIDHDSPSGDDCPRSYDYTGEYYGAEPYPHIVADLDAVLRRVCKSRVGSDPPAARYEHSRRLIFVVMSAHDSNVVRDQNPSSDTAIDLNRTELPYICVLTYV